jgi:hypothetical protein
MRMSTGTGAHPGFHFRGEGALKKIEKILTPIYGPIMFFSK